MSDFLEGFSIFDRTLVIVSAAHCFNMPQEVKQYEIVLNKIPRSQKTFKVTTLHLTHLPLIFILINKQLLQIKELRFFTTNCSTISDNDIVIVILSERIAFNSDVSPACIEWTRSSEFSAPEGTYGKVFYSPEVAKLF